MGNELLHIGFSNYVAINKIMAIMTPDSSPVRRLVTIGKKDGSVLDATQGRKTKSIIILVNRQMVLSAVNTEVLYGRISGGAKRGERNAYYSEKDVTDIEIEKAINNVEVERDVS